MNLRASLAWAIALAAAVACSAELPADGDGRPDLEVNFEIGGFKFDPPFTLGAPLSSP